MTYFVDITLMGWQLCNLGFRVLFGAVAPLILLGRLRP
jgi:hypothetical protein